MEPHLIFSIKEILQEITKHTTPSTLHYTTRLINTQFYSIVPNHNDIKGLHPVSYNQRLHQYLSELSECEFREEEFEGLVCFKKFGYFSDDYLKEKVWSMIICNKQPIRLIQCAHEFGCEFDSHLCSLAAGVGYLEVIQYFRGLGYPWNNRDICLFGAKGGNVDVMKYIHENGVPLHDRTCGNAILRGNLEVLQYAHLNGAYWGKDLYLSAAKRGDLEIVKYLIENGCPWDEQACEYAAGDGHLEVLKYLHESGFPWNEKTCSAAAYGGHLDVLKYAHLNGCPWDSSFPVDSLPTNVLEFCRANNIQ